MRKPSVKFVPNPPKCKGIDEWGCELEGIVGRGRTANEAYNKYLMKYRFMQDMFLNQLMATKAGL